jgi:hypothetical protein
MTDRAHTESRVAVLAIKLVHTVWFAVESASIAHIFVAGLLNCHSRWTAPALVMAGFQVAVFVGNDSRCPLTGLAESYGAQNGRVSDILLPRWFADRIPQIFTPPLLIGVAALIFHRWRRTQASVVTSDGHVDEL